MGVRLLLHSDKAWERRGKSVVKVSRVGTKGDVSKESLVDNDKCTEWLRFYPIFFESQSIKLISENFSVINQTISFEKVWRIGVVIFNNLIYDLVFFVIPGSIVWWDLSCFSSLALFHILYSSINSIHQFSLY